MGHYLVTCFFVVCLMCWAQAIPLNSNEGDSAVDQLERLLKSLIGRDSKNEGSGSGENRDERGYAFTSPVSGDIQVCIDCDHSCFGSLGVLSKVKSYVNAMLSGATKIYKDNGIPVTFKLKKLYDYSAGDANLNAHGDAYAANNAYWGGMFDKYKQRKADFGCDLAFLVTEDYFFQSQHMVGYASRSALCTEHSYGILAIQKSTPSKAGPIFAHEVGHLFGMFHDDEDTPTAYTSNYVGKWCPTTCTDCLMNTAYQSANSKFSDCSKAQMKEWVTVNKLATCIGSGKRNLLPGELTWK